MSPSSPLFLQYPRVRRCGLQLHCSVVSVVYIIRHVNFFHPDTGYSPMVVCPRTWCHMNRQQQLPLPQQHTPVAQQVLARRSWPHSRIQEIQANRWIPREAWRTICASASRRSSASLYMNIEDLDVAENTLVDARYRAASFIRNQVCCILLNNEWRAEKEPRISMGNKIGWEDASLPHMAIVKRSSVESWECTFVWRVSTWTRAFAGLAPVLR